LVKSNNCVDSSLKVSEDICELLDLELELEGSMDLEVIEDNFGPVLRLELGGLGLKVRENSKGLVKSNGSINSDLKLVKSRSSVVSDFGSGSVYSLSFEKDDITELYIGLQFDSWKAAEYYIKEYERKKKFAVKKYRVQFSADQLVKKRTFVYEKTGIYKPNKVKPSNQQCNKGTQAFINDETQESYEWILQQTLNATGLEPQVILTDIDPAMDAASVSASSSMANIVEALDSRMQQEAMNKSFMA
ncbi:5604_t:CDS:2, partial [Racocetra fulgida]